MFMIEVMMLTNLDPKGDVGGISIIPLITRTEASSSDPLMTQWDSRCCVTLFVSSWILKFKSILFRYEKSLFRPVQFHSSPTQTLGEKNTLSGFIKVSAFQSPDHLVSHRVVPTWSSRYRRGVVVIAVGNEHGDTSSNPGRDWLHFT